MSPETKINILLVDDHPENLLALEGILESLGQNLVRATSGTKALKCLLNQDFAVILLDVQMPDMDGFETATLIRQRERSRHTPIIFLTAFSSSDDMVTKGYSLGAVDYLFKPINADILKSKVTAFVELFQKTAEIERQAAELAAMNAELKKSEERFRSLSASSPVGIFLTDTDGICTYTNPRHQAIFGLSEVEILGEGWAQIIHPDDRKQVSSEWYNALHTGKQYSGEFRIITPGGIERWVYACSSPMYCSSSDLIGHVGSVEDISERKIVEAQKIELIREQTARQEAEAANRLKDEFLATLSHELRTPLNSILGWAKLLRKQKYDEKSVARGLEIVERNALLQTQLINDILDVSRIMRGQLRLNLCPVNLESLISQAVNAVRLEAEAKNIQLECIAESSASAQTSFFVRGDTNRLQQVIGNLLSNAIKFTPASGRIDIRLSTVDEAESTNYSTESTRKVQIEVRDTGIGISPDFLPYVFDRFRQEDGSTTRNHNGLGLGLAIVRHLVQMHGGSVSVTSAGTGEGSTFTVKLPLIETLKQPNSLPMQSLKVGETATATKVIDTQQSSNYRQQENISNFSTQQNEQIKPKNIELENGINLSLKPEISVSQLLPAPIASKEETLSLKKPNVNCLKVGLEVERKPLSTNFYLDSMSVIHTHNRHSSIIGLKILVVDDNEDTRNYLTVVLQESGMRVTAAASVHDAMLAIEKSQYDVLLSDIGMPEEDGYELISKIRNLELEKGGLMRAIALTAYVGERDCMRMLESGFHMYLSKPIEPTKLIEAVSKLISETYM